MYILLRGKLHFFNNGQEITMLPGDIRIFGKGDYQAQGQAYHCAYIYIHFDSPLIDIWNVAKESFEQYWVDQKIRFLQSNAYDTSSYEYSDILLPASFHISDSKLASLEREFSKRKLCHKEINYKAALSWHLMDILNTLSQEHFDESISTGLLLRQNDYNAVQELILYLEVNYAENITSTNLEQYFHINFDHFNRLFKKATGTTIFAYKNKLRINRAKVLLSTSDRSISQIASETGYPDVFSFSHAFKKATGFSPADYAKIHIRGGDL